MSKITLYTTKGTGSLAIQIVANEIGIPLELIHYDTGTRTLSNGKDFKRINPLSYVPAVVADDLHHPLTETPSILAYLADKYPESGVLPKLGTPERREADRLMVFNGTEIAQKQIPMMRKLLTDAGFTFHYNKVFTAYQMLDAMLSQKDRPYLLGEKFSAVDAYVWATLWVELSGVDISSLKHLVAYRARIDVLPSVQKAQQDIEHFDWNPLADPSETVAKITPSFVPGLPVS